ncbi:MAG: hypothetical protein IJC29_00030 [Clostridia bacterium]|nr:hypothetical protein [Clostridia bacterium]
MKIDAKMIAALMTLPDDQLWATIRAVASSKGIALTETPPPKATMDSLRGAFSGADKFDVGQAIKILSSYRDKKK